MTNIFVEERPKLAELTKYLLENKRTYLEKIKRDLGWSKPTIVKYLLKLKREGYIVEEWKAIPAAEAATWIKEIRINTDKKDEILEKLY